MTFYHENSHRLIGKENIKKYIYGGHGVVTLESPSGKHYTYAFKKPKSSDKFDLGTYFVYVIKGRNEYKYVGMLSHDVFRKTFHSEFELSDEEYKGAKYIVSMAHKDMNTPMKLYHEGVCACCGRRLTTPESIVNGVGPVCAKLLKG